MGGLSSPLNQIKDDHETDDEQTAESAKAVWVKDVKNKYC